MTTKKIGNPKQSKKLAKNKLARKKNSLTTLKAKSKRNAKSKPPASARILDNSVDEPYQQRQKDGIEIYFVLGANLEVEEFLSHWKRLGEVVAPSETENLDEEQQKERELKKKIGSVCFRLKFIEAIQYDSRFVEEDKVQASALQVYLLCTCFDTLAGQSRHKRFDEWVIGQDDASLLQGFGVAVPSTDSANWYKQTTQKLHEEYLENHGVIRNIRNLFLGLPEVLQNELVNSYAIVKEGESNEVWLNMPKEKRLRRIVDYLFARRNKFTHQADIAPTVRPARGVSGWVWLHSMEIEKKYYNIYLANSDDIRGETSLLTLVIVGALREMLGFSIDQGFLDLHWRIERYERLFREIYAELVQNERVSFIYLRDDAPDLIDQPRRGMWRFKNMAAKKLQESVEINLGWFGANDERIREALSNYTGIAARINQAIKQYEIEARNPLTSSERRTSAYEQIGLEIRSSQLQNVLVQLAGSVDSMLSTAPQMK